MLILSSPWCTCILTLLGLDFFVWQAQFGLLEAQIGSCYGPTRSGGAQVIRNSKSYSWLPIYPFKNAACHGGPYLNTTIRTTYHYYLSSKMIYWSFNGNCDWYGYWCYGLVVIDR